MESNYWIALIVTYFAVNVAVTVFLFKRDDLDKFQKYAQSTLAWLIPIIGAVIFWRINKNHDMQYKATKEFGGGAANSGGYDSSGDGGSSD